eukprot:TRINITY_DN771_c0_g2_i1.p1 TRINITY_DN771_c0_g2~~TRINITY_DN771_c0_g2_i1.p1  ORF type:complete len:226 (+),score=74.12 TRINITY_DN771_c0_g2_i1:72-749(+)
MLVGPYGFKLIDSAIIKHIVDLAIGIKDTVLALQAPLEEIHMNFNKDAKVLEVVKRIKVTDLDGFVQRCVCVGVALSMRGLFREAQRQALDASVPYLGAVAGQAFAQGHKNVYMTPQLVNVVALAGDCGINVGSADMTLKTAIRRVVREEDQRAVRLLPIAFALSVYSTMWRDAQFISSIEGFNNNVHVLMRCFHDMIEAMNVAAISSTATVSLPTPSAFCQLDH